MSNEATLLDSYTCNYNYIKMQGGVESEPDVEYAGTGGLRDDNGRGRRRAREDENTETPHDSQEDQKSR